MMIERMRHGLGVAAIAAALMVGTGCASAQRGERVYVRTGPPAARVEVIGVAPARGYVWVGGYWNWDRRAYVWVPGRWVAPARGYHRWQPGHWVHDRRGWYWIDGRWR